MSITQKSIPANQTQQIPSFLSAFKGCTLQTFDDVRIGGRPRSMRRLARRKILSSENFNKLAQLQKEGAGMYVSVSRTEGASRKIDAITELNAFVLDLDAAKEEEGVSIEELKNTKKELIAAFYALRIKPHFVIETKNGYQPGVLLNPELKASPKIMNELYKALCRELLQRLEQKNEGNSLIRVIRIPGTWHLKNPDDPFKIQLLEWNAKLPRYDFLEFCRQFLAEEVIQEILHPENKKKRPVKKKMKPESIAPDSNKRKKTGITIWDEINAIPMEEVLTAATRAGGIHIGFQGNADGSKQIIEDDKATSAFISTRGNFVYSSSGKGRAGGPVQIAMWYVSHVKSKADAVNWFKETFPSQINSEATYRMRDQMSESEYGQTSLKSKLQEDIEEYVLELFTDQRGEPYMHGYLNNVLKVVNLHSHEFESWVRYLAYSNHNKSTPTKASIDDLMKSLAARCAFEGNQHELGLRCIKAHGAHWYDLSNKQNQAICIQKNSWKIIDKAPILFRKEGSQKPQITPVQGSDIDQLFDFVNIQERDTQILLGTTLISNFLSGFAHSIICLYGPQGSAKTVTSKILRTLVDPNRLETVSFPKNGEELVQMLDHHWCIPFDNIRRIEDWASDALCRAVTGEGTSKRKLFTDNQDVLFEYRRCVILNGISPAATKSDLVERSVMIELSRIPDEQKTSERKLWKAFNIAKPQILGAIFDILAKAIPLHEHLELDESARMMDYLEWGWAIAEAAGWGGDRFVSAYLKNQKLGQESAITGDTFGQILMTFLQERKGSWGGTATDLLREIKTIAQRDGIPDRLLPSAANVLKRSLNHLAEAFRRNDITYDEYRDKETQKKMILLEMPYQGRLNDEIDKTD